MPGRRRGRISPRRTPRQFKCVHRRPARLLRRQKMRAGGGEHVGPPVPRGDEQQDGEENRLRGKKERDLAVGECQRPGDLRGDVIAEGARQDEARRAERCPGVTSLRFGVYPSREFAIWQRFPLNIDQCRRGSFATPSQVCRKLTTSGIPDFPPSVRWRRGTAAPSAPFETGPDPPNQAVAQHMPQVTDPLRGLSVRRRASHMQRIEFESPTMRRVAAVIVASMFWGVSLAGAQEPQEAPLFPANSPSCARPPPGESRGGL